METGRMRAVKCAVTWMPLLQSIKLLNAPPPINSSDNETDTSFFLILHESFVFFASSQTTGWIIRSVAGNKTLFLPICQSVNIDKPPHQSPDASFLCGDEMKSYSLRLQGGKSCVIFPCSEFRLLIKVLEQLPVCGGSLFTNHLMKVVRLVDAAHPLFHGLCCTF